MYTMGLRSNLVWPRRVPSEMSHCFAVGGEVVEEVLNWFFFSKFSMSMFYGFLKEGFMGTYCKALFKVVIPPIKLMRNKREIQQKQMRRDIVKLLENGEEATAQIRVEYIIREESMMAAQEIMELFCEVIAVRLPIMETQMLPNLKI